MSRSYRKNPVEKDTNHNRSSAKVGKRFANRAVRRRGDALNNSIYKKAYCSWCICDYRKMTTEAQFRHNWETQGSYFHEFLHGHFKTYKQAHLWWRKHYVNK